MPILFDDCAQSGREPYLGIQADPVPSVHNSGWTPSPGHDKVLDLALYPKFERYVQDIIGRFAQDSRIVVWDLYNEPGAGFADLNITIPLVEKAFAWARAIQPIQPLTVCVYTPYQSQAQRILDLSDVISFHSYAELEATSRQIDQLELEGRPLICTEWMARTRESRFTSHLPLFKQHKVGCYHWGLVAGKTQTYFPWRNAPNSPEPDVWFHDVLQEDGTPYDSSEVDFIRTHLE